MTFVKTGCAAGDAKSDGNRGRPESELCYPATSGHFSGVPDDIRAKPIADQARTGREAIVQSAVQCLFNGWIC